MSIIASDSIQLESIKDVYDTAEGANTTASTTAEHFWTDSDGAHVTEVTQTEWSDISDPNYHSGGNTLITATGMDVRDGMTTLASFGSTGAQVGQSGSGHTSISASGLTVYGHDGTDLLANIGYGAGNDGQGGTANAPFYSIGGRIGAIGNWSTAEGINTTASAYASHAEGELTTASGINSHAEGYQTTASSYASHAEGSDTTASSSYAHAEGINTTASGSASHAEGNGTTASGNYAHAEGQSTTATAGSHAEGFRTTADAGGHAEGYRTEATGADSHAGNTGTKAVTKSQTAIGQYNVADPSGTALTRGDYSFIIGNGTADNARSNALTVDWSGNVSAGSYTGTNITASGNITATGDITADDITAGGNISATGSISGASATLTGTLTVGSAPTSNMEVATKKYVDDNSGGGGWTPTFETIRNGISITTTSTNYGTNSISLSDYKYIELRLYNSSSMSSNIYPIETVKAQVNNVYINHGQVCRIGSSNVYLTWKYNDDTHLQMNINSGSNMYVGIFGIK